MAKVSYEKFNKKQEMTAGTLILDKVTGAIYIISKHERAYNLVGLEGGVRYTGDHEKLNNLLDYIEKDNDLVVIPAGVKITLEQI